VWWQQAGEITEKRMSTTSKRFPCIAELKTTREKVISDLVSISREGMGVRGRGLGVVASAKPEKVRDRSAQLYQLLIQPIADSLPKDPNARITFIPQGALFLVPFAALQGPSGKYLIEQHTVLTALSIQVLELTREKRRQQMYTRGETGDASRATHAPSLMPHPSPFIPHPSLVVGNPTMPKLPARFDQPAEQLASLPGAEQEAKAIAPLLGTRAITGDQVTKLAIVQRMPQQRIIHLATHSLLDDFKGLGVPVAIALAPDPPTRGLNGSNGLLTADEILDLQLSAELVV